MTSEQKNGTAAADRVAITGLVLVVALVLAGVASWIMEHEQPIHADEALYLLQLHRDVAFYEADGAWRLLKAWFFEDVVRPPGYRVFAFVPALLFGASPAVARASNVGVMLIATVLIFYLIRFSIDTRAAVVATAVLLSTPGLVVTASWYGTEPSFYLALTCTLYFLLRDLESAQLRRGTVIGLGVSLAAGSLAKTSFAPPAAAAVVAFVTTRAMAGFTRRTFRDLALAILIAVVIAAPWWYYNFRPALAFAAWASGDTAYKVGGGGLSSVRAWFEVVVLMGAGLAQLLCVVALIKWTRLPASRLRRVAAIALSAAIPLPVLAFLGGNHEPRLMSAAFFPAAVALAAVMNLRPIVRTAVTVLLVCATTLLYTPGLARRPRQIGVAFQRWDQFDWNVLKGLVDARGTRRPRIVTLVQTPAINARQIAYAWRDSSEPLSATDAKLPHDLASLRSAVEAADVVVVATAAPNAVPAISPRFPALRPIGDGLRHSGRLVTAMGRLNGFEPSPTILRGAGGSTVAVFFRVRATLAQS